MDELDALLTRLLPIHDAVRAAVRRACSESHPDQLAIAQRVGPDDVHFALDTLVEPIWQEGLERIGAEIPIVVVAEGFAAIEPRPFPAHSNPAASRWWVIIDPVDGTRGLMFGKRSGWVLSGIAPACAGRRPSLADIVLAIQTEIPPPGRDCSDQVWARPGRGVQAFRTNVETGATRHITYRPSTAATIAGGFASFARLMPPGRERIAALEEEFLARVLGDPPAAGATVFEDQYISSAGQLYGLWSGQDRLVVDVRQRVYEERTRAGKSAGTPPHPYDLCTHLIAAELGVSVTTPEGGRLREPLDTGTGVAWVGCANERIRCEVLPVLGEILRAAGLGAAG